MYISEIFYSIQGEGELAGVPSVFVRTSGCNLRCRWCDTRYASWSPEGRQMSLDAVLAEVRRHPCRHAVLTGGEPMVAKGIGDLAGALASDGYHVTIETAATVPPRGIACHLASLSPKLSNSTPLAGEAPAGWVARHEARRLAGEVIAEWLDAYPFQLKFVVTGAGDLAEVDDLLAGLGRAVPPARVFLMPEGVTAGALRARGAGLAEACLSRGYRFGSRLQIELFGNTRGT
jgi:7-carboxy-7-deazaguanine synthase